MPNDDTDPQDDIQEPDPVDWATADLSGFTELYEGVASELNEGSDDAWADARRGPADARDANLAASIKLKQAAEHVFDNGIVREEDLAALRGTGRPGAVALADEYERRAQAAEAEHIAAEEEARLTDEQRAARAAEEAEFAAKQGLEDQIQAEIDATKEAFTEPETVPVKVNMFDDGEGRIVSVTRGEGDEAESHVGLEKAVPFDAAYKRAVKERAGLLRYKDLADTVSDLPAATRPAWWAERTPLEVEVLRRGFGLTAPLSDIPALDEGGQS